MREFLVCSFATLLLSSAAVRAQQAEKFRDKLVSGGEGPELVRIPAGTFIMGGGVSSGKTPVWLHNVLAASSIILYARAYWIEVRLMDENSRLMERFLTE